MRRSDIAKPPEFTVASTHMRGSLVVRLEGRMRRKTMRFTGLYGAGLLCSAIAASSWAGVPGGVLGYPELIARLGIENIPTGAGVRVAQVEVPDGEGDYGPNQGASAEYSTKNFIEMSGSTGTSTHANTVAKNFYGNATSMAPGIVDVHLYEVNHWLTTGFLRGTSAASTPPLTPPAGLRIINNSWVGDSPSLAYVRRGDYAVQTFDLLMINGVNNSSAAASNDPLMSHMYNGVSVGKSGGGHQTGDTLVDGPGRMKPEIVAPGSQTSYATGTVSSVVALLYETAATMTVAGGAANASRSEVIKAVLLAGAEHRSAWTNNPATSGANRGVTSRPLDNEMGVDRVNIDRSHMIMTGGPFAGSASVPGSASAGHAGWALESVGLNSSAYWRFNVPETADEVSILTTWHRRMPIGFPAGDVADFDLELWRVDETGGLVALVGNAGLPYFNEGNVVSNSSVDNIEHLYIKNLQAGAYVLELRRIDNLTAHRTWDAAVAWLLPAPPTCLGDLVSSDTFNPPPDGVIDGADLGALLVRWGRNPGSIADIVSNTTFQPPPDGVVDGADLGVLLSFWGPCQ